MKISPASACATASITGSQVTDDDSLDTSRVTWPSGSDAVKNQVR